MTRSGILAAVLAVVGGVCMRSAVSAHHSFAGEYTEQSITLKGTLTKMEWINPHAWLHVNVKEPSGKVVSWAMELNSPNSLYRRGWKRSLLPPGLAVTVTGYRARNGTPKAKAIDVMLPNGTKLSDPVLSPDAK